MILINDMMFIAYYYHPITTPMILINDRVGVGKPKRYPVFFIFQHDNFLVTDFLQIKTI